MCLIQVLGVYVALFIAILALACCLVLAYLNPQHPVLLSGDESTSNATRFELLFLCVFLLVETFLLSKELNKVRAQSGQPYVALHTL